MTSLWQSSEIALKARVLVCESVELVHLLGQKISDLLKRAGEGLTLSRVKLLHGTQKESFVILKLGFEGQEPLGIITELKLQSYNHICYTDKS